MPAAANFLGMRRIVTTVLTATVVATAVLSASPARAAVAVTGPGGFAAGFLPPIVVIAEGEGVSYTNADIAPHNFIAEDAFVAKKREKKSKWCSSFDKGRCPLFWSPTITAGESTEVLGLEAVRSGDQYAFFCSVHPGMKGTLIVR